MLLVNYNGCGWAGESHGMTFHPMPETDGQHVVPREFSLISSHTSLRPAQAILMPNVNMRMSLPFQGQKLIGLVTETFFNIGDETMPSAIPTGT